MLDIVIPAQELYDEEHEEFIYAKEVPVRLEHSLISISKWESKYHKAFLKKDEKTFEETLDYIRCMSITNVDPAVFNRMTNSQIKQILDYINDPMTATYTGSGKLNGGATSSSNKDVMTSELIYYYMVELGIPFECEKWHINRLFALIHVCEIKMGGNKGMSRKDLNKRNASLNSIRRAKHHTKG